MGTLTVKENLYFSAALRLPSSMTWKEKKQRVKKVIDDLGLNSCVDTKVWLTGIQQLHSQSLHVFSTLECVIFSLDWK